MAEALRVGHLVRQGVAEGVASAIAFAIDVADGAGRAWYAGHRSPDPGAPPCDEATVFDLASLTKPLTTTLWTMRLVAAGRLSLEAPVGDLAPVSDPGLASTPLWRLLDHTSGLPPHRRYYEGLGPSVLRSGRHAAARSALRRMLAATTPEWPPGRREIYSDLGFLLLEWICERADAPLGERWSGLAGHGEDALHFRPLPAAPDPLCAATEQCPWRGRVMQGEVHDDNAWTIGGIAGHAGLFGTLEAVRGAGRAWLRALRGDGAGLGLPDDVVPAWTARRWMHPQGTRVLGWDTPTPGASSSGRHFGRTAVGHLGFTGTSIWLDPVAGVSMVLLTNRVCPSRDSVAIRAYRPAIHDAGHAWIQAAAEGRFT